MMLPAPGMHPDWREWADALLRQIGPALLRIDATMALPRFSVADLPSAIQPGILIYVPDETGGATVAFSDGTNWRRVQDRAICS